MTDNKEKILYVLNEWFEEKLPPYIERTFPWDIVDADLITVLAGVRRSGKTYLLYQMAERLRKDVPPENIVYINLEDDRLYPLTGTEIGDILTVYRQNFRPSESHKVYLLLDEVQNIPDWERVLRRLYDRERNLKMVITGSNARLLSSEIASSLRGRTLTCNVYPFSFREFLDAREFSYEAGRLRFSKKKDTILLFLKEYIEYGGFPQVISEKAKMELLREYYRSIMYRDIIERNSIRNIPLFENFLKLTVQNMSARFSYTKVANVLKSVGYKVGKNTLIEYLRFIEDAFMAFEVPVFSYKVKDQLQHPRKIYLIDTGIRNAVSFRFTEDAGRLAENVVFVELMRRHGRGIYYWKDQQDKEVDFVIRKEFDVTGLIQVCWSLTDEKTVKREISALVKAMEEFKIHSGLILTEDTFEDREVNGYTIHLRPLWHWLLEGG